MRTGQQYFRKSICSYKFVSCFCLVILFLVASFTHPNVTHLSLHYGTDRDRPNYDFTHREFNSKSCRIKPKSDCSHHFKYNQISI